MGYEIAEQLDWKLPDVIIYPTGGGTGMVGMWKAFDEMEEMGLIGPKRPRMVTVQAPAARRLCAPSSKGVEFAELWEGARRWPMGCVCRWPWATSWCCAPSARVAARRWPCPTRRCSSYARVMGSKTGIFPAPEGAACLAAQTHLLAQGWIGPDESVVLFNTGSGLKYAHLWAMREELRRCQMNRSIVSPSAADHTGHQHFTGRGDHRVAGADWRRQSGSAPRPGGWWRRSGRSHVATPAAQRAPGAAAGRGAGRQPLSPHRRRRRSSHGAGRHRCALF